MAYIRDNQSDFDFIVLTGDMPRHAVDDDVPRSHGEAVAVNLMVRSALAKYFPTKPVVFSIGNNDLFVHDQLGEGIGVPDLKAFFLIWRHFIPRDQWKTFATSGYYRITGFTYPLDVISLNTLYFYAPNKLVEDCSVKGSAGRRHLKWLKRQLKSCRKRGAFAYLVGHIAPSAKQYYPGCLKRFVKITRKYADVIHTQLYGHSNYDEFFLAQSQSSLEPTMRKGKKPRTFGLIAPSMVPILNPAYRFFTFDLRQAHFGRLLDYEQYYVDLDEANEGEFRVQLEYMAQDAYGPGPLTAEYYRRLQGRIAVESNLKDLYRLHRLVKCRECPE